MTRRTVLLALAASGALAADPAQETWDLIAAMASALSEDDAGRFLRPFDPAMPGFAGFRAAVEGLLNEVQVDSAIDPVENTGDNQARNVVVNWSMHLADRTPLQHVTDRQATVKMRLGRQHGKWKVVSFEPVSLFAAP